MLMSHKKDEVPTASHQFYKTLNEQEKEQMIKEAAYAFGKFLDSLKIDWQNDPESIDTPQRVAKMYVNNILQGRFHAKPQLRKIQESKINTLKIIGPITIRSLCMHHYTPFFGSIIIGISGQEVLGISKYTKICNWYSKRGQIQEKLGEDILQELKEVHNKSEVGIFIHATHTCTSHAETGDTSSKLYTIHTTDGFNQNNFTTTCMQMI